MTVMPSEKIFMIFLLAPLLMYIWEHVVRTPYPQLASLRNPCSRLCHVSCIVQVLDHQHIHPLADGSTAGCSDVGCEDGCGGLPEAPPEDSTPGSGWAFKPMGGGQGQKMDAARCSTSGLADVAPREVGGPHAPGRASCVFQRVAPARQL